MIDNNVEQAPAMQIMDEFFEVLLELSQSELSKQRARFRMHPDNDLVARRLQVLEYGVREWTKTFV